MPATIEVTPFVIDVTPSAATFRFDRASFEDGFEYPPNLEGLIAGAIEANANQLAGRRIVVDLEHLPAISSKQLGAMLAVRQACSPTGKVRVLNLRPNVRELLQITKLSDFFEWD